MWQSGYWAKTYWAGTYWHPSTGAIIIAAVTRFTGMVANVGRLMTR